MLEFYDCNCAVGLTDAPEGRRIYQPLQIANEARRCGIAHAFAYHNAALTLHPIDGNREMQIVTEQHPFFSPVWVVMPNATGEFFDPAKLLELLKKEAVQMVRLFPRYNSLSYSLSDWCCGELLQQLEQNGIVVLLDADQTEWETIHLVCENHPALKLIVTNIYYRNARYLFSLLKSHPNLYAETSGLKSFGLLQTLCERVGADRLLFGSNLGVFSAGSAVCLVTYAQIPQMAKEMIASRNLLGLLEKEVSH